MTMIPTPMPIPDLYRFQPTTPPDIFAVQGRRLSNRQLHRRWKRNSFHTSPKKSKRARARKGFRMGRPDRPKART